MLQSNHSVVRRALQTAGAAAAVGAWFALGAAQGVSSLPDAYREWRVTRAATLKAWSVPRAGESGLPPNVRAMVDLLRDRRIDEFRLSEALSKGQDEEARQRLAEGAYPIRIAEAARYAVLLTSEPLPARCRALASRQTLLLADCG